MSERFEVRKYGHRVPLGDSTCRNCGRAMKHNLATPQAIVMHVDDGQPNDCRDPWPAANIEAAEIDGAALEGAGTSASTNEASTPRSVESVPRVDGSDASVRLPPELPPTVADQLQPPEGLRSTIFHAIYESVDDVTMWQARKIRDAVLAALFDACKVGEQWGVRMSSDSAPELGSCDNWGSFESRDAAEAHVEYHRRHREQDARWSLQATLIRRYILMTPAETIMPPVSSTGEESSDRG